MARRSVRLILFLLIAIAFAAAALRALTLERGIDAARDAARTFDDRARAAIATVAELRAAQQAYVAAGQGDAFWIGRVSSLLESLDGEVTALKKLASAPGTVTALETASGAIDSFVRMDARAREHLRNGQRLLASDLIFTDGLELTTAAAGQLDAARQNERQALDRVGAAERRDGWTTLGAAAGIALLLALLLVPTRRRDVTVRDTAATEPPAMPLPVEVDRVDERADLMLREPAARRPSPASAAVAPPAPDLQEAARVCTDLGRVADPRELSGLLQRIAALLEAPGVIVWVADQTGRELRPTLAHGYSSQALARIGSISRDGDNATAAAFRHAQLHVVKGGAGSNGAIAVPLVTSAGCVGVMAAEVTEGRESNAALKAVASILAAQLATLIAIPQAADSEMKNVKP